MSAYFFGGVPKRSTGADCKSAGDAFVGSNPTPSTRVERKKWNGRSEKLLISDISLFAFHFLHATEEVVQRAGVWEPVDAEIGRNARVKGECSSSG